MEIKGISGDKKTNVTLLGRSGNLKWKNTDSGMIIYIPDNIRRNLPCDYAWTAKISDAVIIE